MCDISVSHHFGFGMMDAAAMVELAMNWTRVSDQHRCQVDSASQPRYRLFHFSCCRGPLIFLRYFIVMHLMLKTLTVESQEF